VTLCTGIERYWYAIAFAEAVSTRYRDFSVYVWLKLWHCPLQTFGLEELHKNPRASNRIPYVIHAFQDIIKMMQQAGDERLAIAYEDEIRNTLEKKVIVPLCTEIEANLRLHLHSARYAHVRALNKP